MLDWFKTKVEKEALAFAPTHEEKKRILFKLNQAVVFENFLHTKYLGQKRFSLEGAESTIPFLDAVVVRYVDDRMRSRVAGIRIAISFGVSGIAVFLLGPIVKATGFETLLISMTLIACFTAFTLTWLPSERRIASAILRNQNQ